MDSEDRLRSLAARCSALLLCASAAAAGASAGDGGWDARKAEHLLNRAGFGASAAEIERAVRLGQDALIAELIAGAPTDPFFYEPPPRPSREELRAMDEEARRKANGDVRRAERELLTSFAGWWVERMLEGPDPLRERMTLFWHGYFTSSFRDVRDPAAMIEQNELLRRLALGRFQDLLRGIVRDPAMLEYLDNNQNRKSSPNENFARELMELFTLGEGNFGEQDVKEAARALTGWVARRGEDPRFLERAHDGGEKTILGRTGPFDADDLVAILLEEPACPRWLSAKLLEHFEGRAPEKGRLSEYATFLQRNDYRIDLFLDRLFHDAAFYAPEVMGERIAGPIDYLVGSARRLGVDPPGELVWLAAGQLGQRLLDPPNVKGWEGGRSWITTATFLQRGNFAGMMLGVVRLEDVLAEDPSLSAESAMEDPPGGTSESMDGAAEPEMNGDGERTPERKPGPGGARTGKRGSLGPEMSQVRRLLGGSYRPGIHLTSRCQRAGARSDAAIVDSLCQELLAVPVSPKSRATLLDFLARERAALGAADGELLERERHVAAEKLLRRLAHLILSLPEAQLC